MSVCYFKSTERWINNCYKTFPFLSTQRKQCELLNMEVLKLNLLTVMETNDLISPSLLPSSGVIQSENIIMVLEVMKMIQWSIETGLI